MYIFVLLKCLALSCIFRLSLFVIMAAEAAPGEEAAPAEAPETPFNLALAIERIKYDLSLWSVSNRKSLGLDCGGVMSTMDSYSTNAPPWWSCTEGFWCFLMLYKFYYGLDLLFVCSRVNGKSNSPWVKRFARSIGLFVEGMSESSFYTCNTYEEKGSICSAAGFFGADAFVDDHMECLLSIHRALPDCILIGFNADDSGQPIDFRRDTDVPGSFWKRFLFINSWWDMSLIFGCTCSRALWDELLYMGPPREVYNVHHYGWFATRLRAEQWQQQQSEQHPQLAPGFQFPPPPPSIPPGMPPLGPPDPKMQLPPGMPPFGQTAKAPPQAPPPRSKWQGAIRPLARTLLRKYSVAKPKRSAQAAYEHPRPPDHPPPTRYRKVKPLPPDDPAPPVDVLAVVETPPDAVIDRLALEELTARRHLANPCALPTQVEPLPAVPPTAMPANATVMQNVRP